MMRISKVFIIVLNWNGYSDTVECLRSLQSLKYPSYEVVVVDNGSTDGSIPKLRQEFKYVIFIENKENLGYTGGNNVGINYAIEKDAEYIWLLNNDVIVEPDSLSKLVEVAQNENSAGLIGAKILQMENHEIAYSMVGRLNWWFPWPDRMEGEKGDMIRGDFLESDFLSGAALLVKRWFVERVGPLDERFFFYWEENDWCERGHIAGFKSVFVPEAVVYHKGGVSSGKGWNTFTAFYLVRNWILFMRKHAKARYWVTFLPFLAGCLSYWIVKAMLKRDMDVVRAFMAALSWHVFSSRILPEGERRYGGSVHLRRYK